MKQGSKLTGELWRDNWITPNYIMALVEEYFNGDYFDPFPVNPEFDAFTQQWEGSNFWLNPPYSKLSSVVKLPCYKKGSSLWLTHHSHDTVWFKTLSKQCLAQCHIDHRVKFIDPRTNTESENTAFNKCQSLTLITPYTGNLQKFSKIFSQLGVIMVKY